jgi:CheY-like chemotaxis protein
VTARSAAEAFAAVEKLARVDVLIVDHSLTPDRGRDVAERLLLKYPEMKIMHISGWLQEQMQEEGSLTPGAALRLERNYQSVGYSEIPSAVRLPIFLPYGLI